MVNNKGEEVGIIYGWYNTLTDMWYIGQTIDEKRRFKTHVDWAINKKDNNRFHNALRKYGLDKFVYCVLEDNVLKENLNMMEIDWIEYYDSYYSGYNLTTGGDTNYMVSEEIRRKISESHKGKKTWNSGKTNIYSDETKRKQSESHKGKIPWNKGIPMTEEARKKSSESHKSPRPWMIGKHPSEETRKKISESKKSQITWNHMPVSKYDLNGNFIKTYPSIREAIKQNSRCTALAAVCKGLRKTAGGFIWKYA